MPKLKLVAEPTFKASVPIPVPGSDPVPVEFTFKHRTKKTLEEFVKSREGKTDADAMMDMVSAWDLADEFTKENVETFCDNYAGAGLAVFIVYLDQLIAGKTKNLKPSP